ncbi:MAG: hypothetical protein WAT79_04580 [Saprospiraceae bacterium]
MKHLIHLSILCMMIFAFSCKHHHGPVANPLYNEVMAIHDEVMPQMGPMNKLKKKLKTLKEENPESKDVILSTIVLLENADEGMMDWMANFKVPEEANEATTYLQNEKIKIQKVSDDMKFSMVEAQNLLDSLSIK